MIHARTTTSCWACRRRVSACTRAHSRRGMRTRRGRGPGSTPLQSIRSTVHFHEPLDPGTNFGPAVLVVVPSGVCDPHEKGTRYMVNCNKCGAVGHCVIPDA